MIRDAKNVYYHKLNTQLSDPCLGPKKWWSYLKSILSPHNRISIPGFLENAVIVYDPQQKVKLFNEYFVSQAKVSDSDHQLPSSVYFHNSNDKILSVYTSIQLIFI